MRSKPRCLVLASLCWALPFGCTADNPAFGDTDSGSDETGRVTASSASVSSTSNLDEDTGDEATSDASEDTGEDWVCGNGVQEAEEECDEGELNSEEGACQPDCTANLCGDGKVGPGQPCDDGPKGSDTCSPDCVLLTCGDGEVQRPEECEPATSDLCTPACTINVCGDGHMLGEEPCDDGDADDTNACVDGCHVAICGDGHIYEGVEACDDENNDDFDACLTDCTANVCGDMLVNPDAEQCDGPIADMCESLGFDGGIPICSADCAITGCTTCGDGSIEGAEECEPELFETTSCAELGLVGEGEVTCGANTCAFTPASGDCCAPAGTPCLAAVGCCNGCDQGTQLCIEG